jgi:putative PIN family toxin of toxin-antitoxin system
MPSIPVVYDCMIYLQAVANSQGPAFRCLEMVESQRSELLLCPSIVAELHDVLNRPLVRSKFSRLTPERVTAFLEKIAAMAKHFSDPPHHFALQRDPDDEPYLNLAIEGNAKFLVTWNEKHLTYLMHSDAPEAIAYRGKYPSLTITNPPDFLRRFNPEV